MSKLAIVSFAVLTLGSSAALAQPYGYGQYGYGQCGQPDVYTPYGEHIVCGRNLAHIQNFIIDPATGRTITQQEYQARYPWTNSATWTYDCASNLWTDHTAEQNPGYAQNFYRGRGHRRGRD